MTDQNPAHRLRAVRDSITEQNRRLPAQTASGHHDGGTSRFYGGTDTPTTPVADDAPTTPQPPEPQAPRIPKPDPTQGPRGGGVDPNTTAEINRAAAQLVRTDPRLGESFARQLVINARTGNYPGGQAR